MITVYVIESLLDEIEKKIARIISLGSN